MPRLQEMLTLDNKEAIRYEGENRKLRAWKQNLVIINGLRGVRELYSVNTSTPVDESLRATITALDATHVSHEEVLRAVREAKSDFEE